MKMMMLNLLVLSLLFGIANSWSNHNSNSSMVLSKEEEEAYLKWVKRKQDKKNGLLFQKANHMNKLKPCLIIKVNKKSKSRRGGGFVSVGRAIKSIPIVNNCRVIISIGPGIYREKIEIPASMAYITIKGAGAENTIIEWDDTADKMGQFGHPLGTYASATFAVNSPYFIAKNIAFKNKAPSPVSGAVGKQGVAMRISADKAAFIGCKFIGGQDTLYDHIGRHYFKKCYIQGSVDFIFGNGLSLYEKCHLHAITNRNGGYGALTAQKRASILDQTGFSFLNCKVTGSGALYLGRAWGTFSTVVFAFTYMDNIITPSGWYDWGDKNRQMTVFFGQYKCSGPGAEFAKRVSWSRELTQQQARPFISIDFIDGQDWLPI